MSTSPLTVLVTEPELIARPELLASADVLYTHQIDPARVARYETK